MRVEHLQILIFARMICSKQFVPHQIIQAEFGATPLQLDVAFQVIIYLHRVREFGSSSSSEGGRCWYSHFSSWSSCLGLDIDRLPPFPYSLDAQYTYASPLAKRSTRSSVRIYYICTPLGHGWPPQAANEARILPWTLSPDSA